MSERTNRFNEELDRLISFGDDLYQAITLSTGGKEFEKAVEKTLGKAEAKVFIEKLPNFKENYQSWYSEAQALIKQILPNRLSDFNSHYEFTKVRKEITFANYMVRDYLQGLMITRGYNKEVVVDGSAAIPEFVQQLNILKAARNSLDSSLRNISAILQADLFDSEIDSARGLLKAGFLRGAGAICGVVIEKHLQKVCADHEISVRKKNPAISDLNQLLKDNDVLDIPQWRYIQHLADLRNISDHAKEREPTKENISDLVLGTDKILKTVF